MVAEDEHFVCDFCDFVLKGAGFNTLLAKNGRQAFDCYSANRHDIDLILSDVVMPEMDGISFVRNVFESDPYANVILMTGHMQDNLVPEDLMRICSVLPKPFGPKQLLSAVHKCIGSRTTDELVGA